MYNALLCCSVYMAFVCAIGVPSTLPFAPFSFRKAKNSIYSMQSCAVIGCGPAGICAASSLRQSGLLVTCFEVNSEPGGMWTVDSKKVFSSYGITSPMHSSMRCILPKDTMAFSRQRFPYSVPQFPHHSSVKQYLQSYAFTTGVGALTRFNTKVQSVRYDNTDATWKVVSVNVRNGDILEWSFDRVCVCSGQTQEPRFPPDLKAVLKPFIESGGEVEHACYVKDFRSLKRKRVVVIGDGVTAADYCSCLLQTGAEVYHSTTSSAPTESSAVKAAGRRARGAIAESVIRYVAERRALNPQIQRVGKLKGCDGRGLLFAGCRTAAPRLPHQENTEELFLDDVDVVVSATGYTQRYPFLHPDVRRLVEEENTLLIGSSPAQEPAATFVPPRGLFLGTIYRSKPSLAFVGLQKELLPPFLVFEAQAKYVSYAFTSRVALPVESELVAYEQALNSQLGFWDASSTEFVSSSYYDMLHQQLGVSAKETYRSALTRRRGWMLTTAALRLYHKLRSMAPLKRKKQHLLFSNEI